jgi:poly(3-hydroxybutyrate) depolymerase
MGKLSPDTTYSLPGLDIAKTTPDIDADDAMWGFFIKHPKQ